MTRVLLRGKTNVLSDGPVPCRYAVIGEGPGKEEDRQGLPFVGISGQILDTHSLRHGLSRARIWVWNLVKRRCFLPNGKDRPPTEEEIAADWPDLERMLRKVDPRYILAVGVAASRHLLGDKLFNIEADHGQIFRVKVAGKVRIVMPAYHTAAGLRRKPVAVWAEQDIASFCRLDPKGHWPLLAKVEEPSSVLVEGRGGLARLRASLKEWGEGAVDTEGLPTDPFCLSVSEDPRESYVVRAKDVPTLFPKRFHFHLHNASWDLPVLRAMGVEVASFSDTMQLAYLHNEPKSLKNISRRLYGHRMLEFEKLVAPHVEKARKTWLLKAHKATPPGPQAVRVLAARRLKAVERDLYKGKPVHLAQRWKNWTDDVKKSIATDMGSSFPQEHLSHVPEKDWVKYAGWDAANTRRLVGSLDPSGTWLERVAQLDMAVLPMVTRMEEVGLPVNLPRLKALGTSLTGDLLASEATLRALSSPSLDPWSPDQVAGVIYGDLGMQVGRRTKSGARGSTEEKAVDVLLAGLHQELKAPLSPRRYEHALLCQCFLEELKEFRELGKDLGTYILPLDQFIREGRLHYRLQSAEVITGRLAARDPNVLSFPVKTERGLRIRHCFVAGRGRKLAACDLSQIELRTMAHQSEDPEMLRAFLNDEDLHQKTASLIFGVQLELVSKKQRYVAKRLNFAILYEISAFGLYEQLVGAGEYGYDLAACEGLITEWFRVFKGVRRFLDQVVKETRRRGYVETPLGRRRYLPNIYLPTHGWKSERLQAEAERHAGNYPIQGGAGETLKRSEVEVWDGLKAIRKHGYVECLLQIHDELIFEFDAHLEKPLSAMVVGAMQAEKMRVPVKANWSSGRTWGELK